MAATSAAAPLINDRYELRALLGERGTCSTHLALDRQTRATVAVKELSLERAPKALAARLEAAFHRLRAIDHPRVPRFLAVLEYERAGPRVALVQQFVKGKTLAQHVAEGRRFEPAETLKLALSLSQALAYIHRLGLLHGAIQPRHILLDAYDAPHLIDFGVVESVLEEAGVPTGAGGGPPSGYVAFEQFAGRPMPASDVYALGMTLAFALTGHEPLDKAAAWDGPAIDPVWPEPLKLLLRKMTAPSWEERIRDGQGLVAAVDRAMTTEAGSRYKWRRLLWAAPAVAWVLFRSFWVPVAPLAPPPSPAPSVPAPAPAPQQLFHGEAAEAARRFLGAVHESGDVAWEIVDRRVVVFLNGVALSHPPAARQRDGTLAVVDGYKVLIGRPDGWRRRLSLPDQCYVRRLSLDEYENVSLETTCGSWRHGAAWERLGDGRGDPDGARSARDAEGRTWLADPRGRVTVLAAARASP
ncbi:MAG: serine/threonine protein kinase [Elusimicrobia bacterium]|nr:serine/threonine protein kinase [Elusimicrobiota bacterium]